MGVATKNNRSCCLNYFPKIKSKRNLNNERNIVPGSEGPVARQEIDPRPLHIDRGGDSSFLDSPPGTCAVSATTEDRHQWHQDRTPCSPVAISRSSDSR